MLGLRIAANEEKKKSNPIFPKLPLQCGVSESKYVTHGVLRWREGLRRKMEQGVAVQVGLPGKVSLE